jgi:hypothetical protein
MLTPEKVARRPVGPIVPQRPLWVLGRRHKGSFAGMRGVVNHGVNATWISEKGGRMLILAIHPTPSLTQERRRLAGKEPDRLTVRPAVRGSARSRRQAGAEQVLCLRRLRLRGGGGGVPVGARDDSGRRWDRGATVVLPRAHGDVRSDLTPRRAAGRQRDIVVAGKTERRERRERPPSQGRRRRPRDRSVHTAIRRSLHSGCVRSEGS